MDKDGGPQEDAETSAKNIVIRKQLCYNKMINCQYFTQWLGKGRTMKRRNENAVQNMRQPDQ